MAYASGYYGYPAPTSVARPVFGLGLATQLLLIAQVAASGALVFPTLHEHDLLHRIKTAPGSVTLEEAQHADNTITALSGVITVLTVATAVVWIIWFFRARDNAGGWAPLMQRRSAGWAIGGWFCPIVFLWFPYTIAKDSLDGAAPEDQVSRVFRPSHPLLTAWWLSWLAVFVVGFVEGSARGAGTVDDLTQQVDIEVAAIIVRTTAAVLAILVVRQITNAQQARLAVATPTADAATPWAV
jgi:heme/copper-type cytochrome/quinol oxidase subunit 2